MVDFTKKGSSIPRENFFTIQTYSDSNNFCDAIACEVIIFWKYQMVLRFNVEMYKKLANNSLSEKNYLKRAQKCPQ